MDDPQSAPARVDFDQASDADLVRACRDGDAAAWRALIERYERLVYAIPLRMGLDRDDAADVFQLTCAALLNSLDAIHDPARLGGWLATVARRHSWATIRRRAGSVPLAELDDGAEAALAAGAAALGAPGAAVLAPDRIQSWELALWLDQGLVKLSAKCRDLLTALYLDVTEPSYVEVAARLGIPVGSIGPTRARCLERLRQVLEAS